MPGGYFSPFANPCGWPAWTPRCSRYAHKQPKYKSVAASVNITGGVSAPTLGQITPDGGVPTLPVTRLFTGCSAVGSSQINDVAYPCTGWPDFFSDPNGTSNIRQPSNYFQSSGVVDLSGPCRAVGRQQAQFIREWHGRYGFDTSLAQLGVTNYPTTPYTRSSTKYCIQSIVASITQGISVGHVTYDNLGIQNGSVDNAYSGSTVYNGTMTVDPNSGVRTFSGGTDSSTTQVVENVSGTITTSIDPSLIIFAFPACQPRFPDLSSIVEFHDGSFWVQMLGSPSLKPTDWLAWANVTTGSPPAYTNIGSPFVIDGAAAASYSTSLSVSATQVLITITCTGGVAKPGPTGPPNTSVGYSIGTGTLSIAINLSGANTLSGLYSDIESNLEVLWDYHNIAKHPLRTDDATTYAPLYARDENPTAQSPDPLPGSTQNGTTNGGFSVDDRRTWNGSIYTGQIAWFDDLAYIWIYNYSAGQDLATALAGPVWSGSVIDAMAVEGTGAGTITDVTKQFRGYFDFQSNIYGTTSCIIDQQGQATPSVLPPNCRHWTDERLSGSLFPCEFVAAGGIPVDISGTGGKDDIVYVQRWREARIPVPSENPCRPYGADKTTLNWDLVLCCDNSGNFYPTADCSGAPYSQIPLKYPNCSGLTFSDATGVGGRVKVLAMASGVVQVDLAQPYFCRDGYGTPIGGGETVKVYDGTMTLLGTTVATVGADNNHFAVTTTYATAAWITPVFRNDGSTAWHYYDCDDMPKGKWLNEFQVFDFFTGGWATTIVATAECAPAPVDCNPTMLQAVAGFPSAPWLININFVKQWQVSDFWMWDWACAAGNLVRGGIDLTFCILPEFVEAHDADANNPGQISYNACSANTEDLTPWNIFLSCPASFPL